LQDLLNECIRKEATNMTLIIVNKKKGWLNVKDINKLSCPRITRGAPKIVRKELGFTSTENPFVPLL
jgi:hypothetical protein